MKRLCSQTAGVYSFGWETRSSHDAEENENSQLSLHEASPSEMAMVAATLLHSVVN